MQISNKEGRFFFFWSFSGDPLLASTQELQDVGPMTAVVFRVPHEGNGRILQIRSLFDQLLQFDQAFVTADESREALMEHCDPANGTKVDDK